MSDPGFPSEQEGGYDPMPTGPEPDPYDIEPEPDPVDDDPERVNEETADNADLE
jgi:hypothetical protein